MYHEGIQVQLLKQKSFAVFKEPFAYLNNPSLGVMQRKLYDATEENENDSVIT